MEEQELSKKERKELRRKEKLEKREASTNNKVKKKYATWAMYGLIAAIIIAGGYLLFTTTSLSEPMGEDHSTAMPDEGAEHIQEGQEIAYESNPPTSGPHWVTPLSDGIYDSERPDEAVIHSLEHGRIWISYDPNIPENIIQQLEDRLSGEGSAILTPREENDTDIALAAWRRLDKFNLEEIGNELPMGRINDFIRRYKHQAPEYVPSGQGGGSRYE